MIKKQYSQSWVFQVVILFGGTLVCCLSVNTQAAKTPPLGYILHIQMTPAVCALDATQQKQRKCLEGYSLTIGSLVPENMDSECATTTSPTLPPLQAKVVANVIPDEPYRTQLWRTVGGCMQMNASQYFRTIINYAQNLKIPAVLTDSTSHSISKQSLENQFLSLNHGLPERGIHMTCQKEGRSTFLTHISVCYKTNGQFKNCPESVLASSCPNNFNVQGTY
ncbi:hypothetical protein GCM10027155_19000 [Acinetobacter apis]|uniref:Ribonuclease T2 n=1 Tax=Acinetobacter apis TaxID=1229165 RepID=A0A217EGN4_9GAMM|nr:ribonuclease I [Acinetobacter apis]SNQ29360.1 ribonuclease T2 [Acinetobacter apis]